MFIAKKFLSQLAFPLPLSLELLAIGLVLLWTTRRQRAGRVLVSLGAVLLLLLSHRAVADPLLGSLEFRYPALHDAGALATREGDPPVKWVVVLGGGSTADKRLPVSARLSGPSLARLVEGVRIQKGLPGSKLVVSAGDSDNAEDVTELARAFGVSEHALVLERGARDTEQEAEFTQRIIGADALVLVTSASHMPRALALFQKRGLSPIPAPTDYLAGRMEWDRPDAFLPSAGNLGKSTRAFYEYLGLAWARVRGKI